MSFVGLEDGRRAGRCRLHALIVLVEDLTDQLFQQILEGRDAEGSAELVEQHGEMAPLALHVEQQIAATPAGRRNRHRADRERVAGTQLEEIERVQHPDDLVQSAAG